MKVFWDPVQLLHAPNFFLVRGQQRTNLEVPARAQALLEACQAAGLTIETPPPIETQALEIAHTKAYLNFLAKGYAAWAALPDAAPEMVANVHASPDVVLDGRAPRSIVGQVGWYTADAACPIGPHTWDSARAAASCAVAAADEASDGRNAYALTRPPGHHAYRARAGGHCYLNNAVIAAERLRNKGASFVAILDIDSHHGNGTQGYYWYRGDILYVSVHADPDHYYPWFTGRAIERGEGSGKNCNLNLPLPMGSGDVDWLTAISDAVEAIREFNPDAMVLSLGFDASEDEPLKALRVTPEGFQRAGLAITGLRIPTVIVQEGGYAVDRLGALLTRFLDGFLT
jgi:acetoin utilization deacetylase AcuC-like enzyme